MSSLNSSGGSNSPTLSNDTDIALIDGVVQCRENEGPRPSILSVHGTAISHASSTPMVGHQQNQIQELVCENISSIFLTPQPPRRSRRLSSRSFEDGGPEVVSSSTDRQSVQKYNSDYSDDSFDETPRKRFKRTPSVGNKCWDTFKPRNEDSLYYLVVNQPNNLDEHVWNWIQLYRTDNKAATYKFIQFFVDICGFENIHVSAKYNMDCNYEDFKLSILHDMAMIRKVMANYLFKFKIGWALEKQSYVYDFIGKLMVAQARVNIFYIFDFLQHFLYLFSSLIGADLKSTVNTCGYIVPKMYTIAKKFQRNVEIDLENLSLNQDERETLEAKRNVTFGFVTALLSILKAILSKTDSSLREMFAAVMEEMKIWLKMDVAFISNDLKMYITLISKVICNKTGKLRKAAITTCKEFVKLDKFKEVLDETTLKEFLEMVGGRVSDINDDVAVVAIDIHTEILRKDLRIRVSPISKGKIMVLLYDNIRSLAFSAGRFYSEIISFNRDKNCGTLYIIRHIMHMHKRNIKHEKSLPFLVESLFPYIPELKDWDFMVRLLLQNDTLVYDDEVVVMELLCESIKQVMAGKGPRMTSSMGKIDKNETSKALDVFLGGFPALQRKYGESLNCLRQLYSVLVEINFKDITLNRFRNHIQDVLVETKQLFFKCTDEELIKNISRYFSILTDHLSPSHDASLGVINSIMECIVLKSVKYLEDVDESEIVHEDDQYIIEQTFLKLLMLYNYHDFTEFISFSFMLDKAVKLEENITIKTRTYIFKCCILHLCHKLQKIIESKCTEQLNNSMTELKTNLDDYIASCFTVISSTEVLSFKYTIFQYVCEVYLNFNQAIYSILDKNPHLSVLILEPIRTTAFMMVAQEYFFESGDDFTLQDRRKDFFNVLQMGFCNGLHHLEFVKLYKYYYSHYDDYGDLIKKHMMQLGEEKILPATMILHTIKYCYVDMSPEDSDAFRKLMLLSCQFEKFLSNKPKEALQFLRLGLQFILPRADHYFMMTFIKPFFALTTHKERNQMANYILSVVPQEHTSNKYIVDCIKFLREKKCSLDYSFVAVADESIDSRSTQSGPSNRIESFSEDESFVGGIINQ